VASGKQFDIILAFEILIIQYLIIGHAQTVESSTTGGFFSYLQSFGQLLQSRTANISYVPLKTVFSTKTVSLSSSCYMPEGQVPADFIAEGDAQLVVMFIKPQL
jgi:hypothetical protein